MKSQKTIIVLALVVAILAIGIAYAAISNQTLNVVGNVTTTVSDANFDVNFIGAEIDDEVTVAPEGATVTATGAGKDATLTVSGLDTKDQTVTAVYTIKNESPQDVTAAISVDIDFEETEWFTVVPTLKDSTLAQGAETTLTLVVTLKDTPVTDAEVAAAVAHFTVTLDAEAQ